MFRKKRHGGWHKGWGGWDPVIELDGWDSDHGGWEPSTGWGWDGGEKKEKKEGWGEPEKKEEKPKGWGEKEKKPGEEITWIWDGEEEVVMPKEKETKEGWGWPEEEMEEEKEKSKGGKVILIKLVKNKGMDLKYIFLVFFLNIFLCRKI